MLGGDSNRFDAFSDGIEPGGLRNRDEIKLLICYMLKSLGKEIPKKLICDSLTLESLANYFEINNAISELEKAGHVIKTDEESESYAVSESGKTIAQGLDVMLPRTVREKAISAVLKLTTLARRELENNIHVEKSGSGYHITFSSVENGEEIIGIRLFASDMMQIERLREGFLLNPSRVYEAVINALSENAKEDI
jgi:predicted transcriptional regulator